MKQRLQRILSILCVLMLATGCMVLTASAEDPDVVKVITVRWEDKDNYEGVRPTGDIVMTINGTEVFLNAGNEWTGSAEAPASAKWTVAQVDGYTPSESGTSDVKVVTYTHDVKTTYLKPSVVWNDEDNKHGLRPDSVRINLLADGSVFRTPATANAAGGWQSAGWEIFLSTGKEPPLRSATALKRRIRSADIPQAWKGPRWFIRCRREPSS